MSQGQLLLGHKNWLDRGRRALSGASYAPGIKRAYIHYILFYVMLYDPTGTTCGRHRIQSSLYIKLQRVSRKPYARLPNLTDDDAVGWGYPTLPVPSTFMWYDQPTNRELNAFAHPLYATTWLVALGAA